FSRENRQSTGSSNANVGGGSSVNSSSINNTTFSSSNTGGGTTRNHQRVEAKEFKNSHTRERNSDAIESSNGTGGRKSHRNTNNNN
ncbi:hypothetical protein FF38_11129, partial [Lucilia cuprina]